MYPLNYPANSSVSTGLSDFIPWLNCQNYEAWILRRELPAGVTLDELNQRFNEEIFPRLLELWEPRGIVMTDNREELEEVIRIGLGIEFEEEDVVYGFPALGLEEYGEPPNFLLVMAGTDGPGCFMGAMYLANVPDNQSVPLFCNAIMAAWAESYKAFVWDESLLVMRDSFSQFELYQALSNEGFNLLERLYTTLSGVEVNELLSTATSTPVDIFNYLPDLLSQNTPLYDRVIDEIIDNTCGMAEFFARARERYGLSRLLGTDVREYAWKDKRYIVFDRDASSAI